MSSSQIPKQSLQTFEMLSESNDSFHWDRKELRNLRLRLGWSQSDLARRLKCEPQLIESIENGQEKCSNQIQNELHMILRQAEVCSDELQIQCQLENTLEKEKKDQIQIVDL